MSMSARQLRQTTVDIMKKHPTLNPPLLYYMDTATLSRVSNIETGKANALFLIIITVPLYNQVPWLAYELKPLAKLEKINNETSTLTILPREKYLVTEPWYDEYFFAQQEFINNCKPIETDMACSPDLPIKSTRLQESINC